MPNKLNTATNRTTEAGNTIYTSNVSNEETVFIGNDGYDSARWGKFTVQSFDGQWNQIENGLMDNEKNAIEAVESLIDDGYYTDENIRYIQI